MLTRLLESMSIRRLWFAISAGHALSIVWALFYVVLKTERSGLVIAFAVVIALVAVLTLALALWINDERLLHVRQRIGRYQVVFAGISLLLMAIWGVLVRPELFYGYVSFIWALTLTLLYWTLFDNSESVPSGSWLWIALIAALLIASFIRVLTLSYSPEINGIDEGWTFSWAVNFVKTGHLSSPIYYFTGQEVPEFYRAMGLWFRVVGIGFWQARLFSFLLIFPTSIFTGLAASNFYGKAAGVFTSIEMFASSILINAISVRPEIGLVLSIAFALWLYTEALRRPARSNILNLLAGAAMGSGLYSHYHAVGFGLALLIGLYLPTIVSAWRSHERVKWRPPLLFIVGGLVILATFVFLHLPPQWETFIEVTKPRNPTTFQDLIITIARHFASIPAFSPLELFLIIAAVLCALYRSKVRDWSLLISLLLMHLVLGAMAIGTWPRYILPITPLYGILIGSMFSIGWARTGDLKPLVKSYALFGCCALMTISLFVTLSLPLRLIPQHLPLQGGTPEVVQWVFEHVSRDQKVAAVDDYARWLYDYRFISEYSSNYMSQKLKSQLNTLAKVWDVINPDFVIIDDNVPSCCTLQPLLESRYFEQRGYRIEATFSGVTTPIIVYGRVQLSF